MTETPREAIAIARDYYDSDDADQFYASVWGGEDIHIGIYDTTEDIRTASRLTVDRMVSKLGSLEGKNVIDLGSGYGGAARVLAKEHGARVTCLNLSEVENRRNRRLNELSGLQNRITVVDGSFDHLPFPSECFDIAWSQDAILHAPRRTIVLHEVERVLKRGGLFAFTDPMQADNVPDPVALQPIYDRIHLPDLASIGFYRKVLTGCGFKEVEIEELTHQLGHHYTRVREVMLERREELDLDDAFVEPMSTGLGHWVEGAAKGNLCWAIMVYRKQG